MEWWEPQTLLHNLAISETVRSWHLLTTNSGRVRAGGGDVGTMDDGCLPSIGFTKTWRHAL